MGKGAAFLKAVPRFVVWLLLGLFLIAASDLVAALHKPVERIYMERYVISPLPPTMVHVKTLSSDSPTLGDGYCWVAYEMTPHDFDHIFNHGKKPWRNGLINVMGTKNDQEKLFHDIWPGDESTETYNSGGEEYILGTVEMVVSPDHTRALFFIDDL